MEHSLGKSLTQIPIRTIKTKEKVWRISKIRRDSLKLYIFKTLGVVVPET